MAETRGGEVAPAPAGPPSPRGELVVEPAAWYVNSDAELHPEFLYQVSMGSPLGSNPVGIDQGQLRGTHECEARRIGLGYYGN